MSAQAAITEERPTPPQQCTTTALPSRRYSVTECIRPSNSRSEVGTDLSSIGKDKNFKPLSSQQRLSSRSPHSSVSAGDNADTITPTPACRNAPMSSASQSCPLGRGIMPSRSPSFLSSEDSYNTRRQLVFPNSS